MKYEVKVKMVEYGYVTVDANSREEADTNAELAVLDYNISGKLCNGNCCRDNCAFKNVLRSRNYLLYLAADVYLTDLKMIAVFVGSD